MRICYALAAAAASVLIGTGTAIAQPMRPNTNSTGCTSSDYFHQYTRYHGTICYTGTGDDDLATSGFWTTKMTAGSNTGRVDFYTTDGVRSSWSFWPGGVLNIPDVKSIPGGVVSVVHLYIQPR
ncbi:hypothetical protein [Streptomyces sp. NPDC051452]|uniref:hypothetical protein n=1 Tax=Streptomyces sp. NPDC051452 TaxID=3365654 RepID=UPI0037970796